MTRRTNKPLLTAEELEKRDVPVIVAIVPSEGGVLTVFTDNADSVVTLEPHPSGDPTGVRVVDGTTGAGQNFTEVA